jgi:conjugative relaxase-like TrwC/TraI family protein
MLSVAKLALGQESYYEQQVALGLDDYHAGRGESPGLWVGSGAEAIELVGAVEDGSLGPLLRGLSPADGERLRAPAKERTITVRTLDEASGVWRDEPKTLAPVARYDLVFSCPKSVSLLHALTDDAEVRRAISEAHESSWQAALSYLEAEACVVRRGRGGAIREHGQGFVAAAFRHRTSRAQDPHLHTHVIVANLARSPDGRWRALDGEAILRTYRLAAGYLYEAHLRHELSSSLGVAWTEPAKGMAEIEGVPPEAIRAFSTRRQSLVEHMQAMGTSGFAASRVAALATRERKEAIDLPDLRESWLARASEMGLGAIELRGLLEREPVHELELPTIAADDVTAHQTTVTTPELVRAVASAARDGASVKAVLAGVEEIARGPELVRVGDDATPGRPARFTTRSLLDLEREALRVALAGRDAGARCAEASGLVMALSNSPVSLSDEQRALVEATALSPDRVVCVEGAAGAGKTTALRVLGDALSLSDVAVLGAAPSGRAADELERATDIPSETLHSLLADARRSGGLPRGCVLVIDEAGMAETRVLAPVLCLVDEARGKAILVGDPAQLPAVGAGGLYGALCERLGAERLVENRRQRELAEREALARLRSGDAEAYLGHAARQGRLLIADSATQAKQQLLADWWRTAEGDLRESVILAHRRVDVRDLNESARTLLLQSGRLGERALIAGDREFRPGDRVVCRHNDSALGVRNGTRASVREIDPVLGIVTLLVDDGPSRQLPARYAAEHLEHGYALTGHGAQGASVERAFVLVRAEGALAEWGYVAASRARTETRLYAVGPELGADAGLARDEPEPATRLLADALARTAAEAPALERLATAGPDERALAREESGLRGPGALGNAAEHARLLGELATGGPPDPAPELRRLEAERAGLGADLARAEDERERAERARAAIGRFRMVGRTGQEEAAHHERVAAEAASRAQDLTAALADAGRRREDLVARAAERDLWHQERLPQILTRLEATERDLAALRRAQEAMSAPLAGYPSPQLAAAALTLTDALERSRPPDPRPQIAHLRDDRRSLERALGAEAARQLRQAERLDQLGLRLLTRTGREEGRQLRSEIERSEQAQERLRAQKAGVARTLAALQPALEHRERWERDLAPALSGRAEVLEGELARRVAARLLGIQHKPPVYLTKALGPRPDRGRGQERWRQGSAAIEGYRERHGMTDPQRALGPEPEERLAPGDRRSVERTVEDARAEHGYLARAHERWDPERPEPGYDRGARHDLGRGMERGLDHGPGLGMGR